MTLKLTFPIVPQAVQSFRVANIGGFIRKYQPEKNLSYKGCLKFLTTTQLPDGFKPYSMPVGVIARYIFPPLKSMPKKLLKRIHDGELIYKPTKPDLSDNLNKATFDALTGVVWLDDSQIVYLYAVKRYGMSGAIELEISEVSNVV